MVNGLMVLILIISGVGGVSGYLFGFETAIKHALILLAVPLVLGALARLRKPEAADDADGWRTLRPGGMHWFGLVGSGGLTAFMLYIYLFVGSSRADADTQMTVLFGLILAFGAGTAIMVVICFLARVRWNGDRIESWLGPWRRGAILWRELAQAEHAGPGAPLVLESMSGLRLKIDATLSGAEELLQRVSPWIPNPDHP